MSHSICLDCLYGGQPFGYFPIVCAYGKINEMYYEKHKCKNFTRAADYQEQPVAAEETPQTPWQVIKGGKVLCRR